VQINPTGITPVPSGGAAMPRISYDAIQALPSPQQGDMAYDNTYKCLRYYNGSKWIKLLNSQDTPDPSQALVTSSGTAGAYLSVKNIKTDAAGNIYISGTFETNSGTGNVSIGGILLTLGVGINVFIAKFSPLGVVQWAQKTNFSNLSYENIVHMEVDLNGAVYLGLNMNGSLTIGSFNFTSPSVNNFVFAKYSTSGVLQFAKQITSPDVSCSAICLDATGLPYLTGTFLGTAIFGSTNITSSGLLDVFIAKYNALGNLVTLIKGGGASSNDFVNDVIIDGNGEIYVTGYYTGAASSFGTNILPLSSSFGNMYLAEYSTITNSWESTNNSSGSNQASGDKLAVDSNNNVYVMGKYWGNVSFDGGNLSLPNEGGLFGYDIFLAKYSGTSLWWINNFGSKSPFDQPIDLITDSDKNITFISQFYTSGNIGGIVASGHVISKIDPSGNFLWTNKSNVEMECLTKSPNGSTIIGGRFSGTQTIGVSTVSAVGTSNPTMLGADLFVSKLIDK
jgi:hypothetical protein